MDFEQFLDDPRSVCAAYIAAFFKAHGPARVPMSFEFELVTSRSRYDDLTGYVSAAAPDGAVEMDVDPDTKREAEEPELLAYDALSLDALVSICRQLRAAEKAAAAASRALNEAEMVIAIINQRE